MKRALVVLLVLIVALPLAAIAAASWFLNGDAIKTRLADQVRRATGRDLTIAGPVTLAWSLSPTIAMSDVSLSNPPGFPQPQMAHVDRLAATLAIGPLFQRRVVIERVAIASPSVRLERDASGRANWDFRPAPGPSAAASTPSEPRERFTLAIGAVDISNATIAYAAQTLVAPHLTYDPASGHVGGTITAAGTDFALAGMAGPIAETAFPVDLRLTGTSAGTSTGIVAALTGTSAAATLTVNAPDLATLSPLVGRPLPSVHDISFSTALPGPGELRLQTGATTIGPLTVQHALLTAASLSDPGTFSAAATIGTLPLTIGGHLASLTALLRAPAPVDARIEAPGLIASATGTLAATGAAELQLAVQSPDLGAAGTQAGVRLPAFRALNATAGLSLSPESVILNAFHLASAQGDLAGALMFSNAGRLFLSGVLMSDALDLDALMPPPIASTPVAPTPVAPTRPAPGTIAPAPAPDTKLPLAPLRAADADLHLTIGSLRLGGATYQTVQAHALLQNGSLRVDPLSTAIGPATARATLQIDAATPPALNLTIAAPGLPFGAVLALAGTPSDSPGTIDIHADLSGSGDTLRAVAATLTGHAGLALVGGQIDNELLERLAAGALRTANIPLEAGGNTTLRCVAIRADAAAGVIQLGTLTLDTSKLDLDGSGTVNLADETLDLHLRPQLRLGGGLSIPLRVRGTLAAPKVTLDPGAIASGRVGILLGGGTPPDTCGPALARARDGQAGEPAAAPPPTRAVKPADLLRGLLR